MPLRENHSRNYKYDDIVRDIPTIHSWLIKRMMLITYVSNLRHKMMHVNTPDPPDPSKRKCCLAATPTPNHLAEKLKICACATHRIFPSTPPSAAR